MSAAPGAADETKSVPRDPVLQTILDRWESLPGHIKATIATLVRSVE